MNTDHRPSGKYRQNGNRMNERAPCVKLIQHHITGFKDTLFC